MDLSTSYIIERYLDYREVDKIEREQGICLIAWTFKLIGDEANHIYKKWRKNYILKKEKLKIKAYIIHNLLYISMNVYFKSYTELIKLLITDTTFRKYIDNNLKSRLNSHLPI